MKVGFLALCTYMRKQISSRHIFKVHRATLDTF
jgi:hypothetical protein